MTDPLLAASDPTELQNVIKGLLARVEALENRYLDVRTLADVSPNLGMVSEGEQFFGTGDPHDESGGSPATGLWMGYPALNLAGVMALLTSMNNGSLQVAITEAGDFVAAGGGYVLNANGQVITGIDFLSKHTATNAGNARMFRSGFQLLGTDAVPRYIQEYSDMVLGTNLITSNPGAETGDLTGWTGADWSASTEQAKSGSYSFKCALDSKSLESNKYAVSADAKYRAYTSLYKARGEIVAYVRWYTSGDVLISTIMIGSPSASNVWQDKSANVISPATAAKASLYFMSFEIGRASCRE